MDRTHEAQPGGEGGLGWMASDAFDKFFGNRGILWHNGIAGGYFSYIAIDTATQTESLCFPTKPPT